MYQSFSPGNSFNGSAYTSSLILNSLSLYDMERPFQVFQGPLLIFSFSPGTINIGGNLTVSGTLTSNNVVVNTYSSGLIHLASGNPADAADIGMYGEYVSGSTVYTGLVRDSSNTRKTWALFDKITTPPTTLINSGNPIGDVYLDNLKVRSIAVLAGTAALPGLCFTSAINSGIYYTGSAVAVSLAGVLQLSISATEIYTIGALKTAKTTDSASTTDSAASIVTLGGISAAKKINCLSIGTGAIVGTSANFASVNSSSVSTTDFTSSTINATGAINLGTTTCNTLQVAAAATFSSISAQSVAAPTASFSTSVSSPLVLATTLTATTLNATTCNLGGTTISGALNVANSGINSITGTTNLQNVNASLGNFTRVITSSGNTSSSASDPNASLVSSGGLSVASNANFGSNVYIGGNLIVGGSTITTQGSNKITGTETFTSINLDITKCAIECTYSGAVVVNLPAFSSGYKGKEYYIVSYSGSITLAPSGTDKLNGSNSALILSGAANTKIYVLGIESGWWTF